MPRVRIVVNGLPFTVDGEGTAEQLAGALQTRLQEDPSLFTKRARQLGLSDEDLISLAQQAEGETPGGFRAETGGKTDRFLIGAGRTLTSLGRGIRQIFSGDETDKELARREKNERELFAQLDDQGIGFEDIGQFAPDVVAFLGSGGLVSLGIRGAALGAATATIEGESRATNTIVSGLLSAAGPGVARAAGAVFRTGTRMGAGAIRSIGSLASRGQIGQQLGKVAGQAANLVNNQNQAIKRVGEIALNRAADIVQRMNARGKEGVVAEAVNTALRSSIRQSGNTNVLDFTAFNRELIAIANSTLNKELGKTFGKQLANLRATFNELGKITEMTPGQAQAVLQAILSRSEARSLAKALRNAGTQSAKKTIAQRLKDTALAIPGQETGVATAQALTGE
jgi:hypothetical protein